MPRKIVAFVTTLLVFTLLAAGCSKSGGATPTATAKAFYDAAKAQDVKTVKSLMSKKSLELLEAFAKMGDKSLDDFLKETSQMPPAFEARNEKVTGDTATLEVKDNGDKWDTLYFIKEDGQWKIAIDKGPGKNTTGAGPATAPDIPPPSTGKSEGEESPSDDEHSTH